MAQNQKQSPTEKAAPDPTVFSMRGAGPEYPEGTHPPVAPEKATWGPNRFSYADLEAKLKPDKSTVAQTQHSDPVADDAEQARRDEADAATSSGSGK